MNSGLGISSLHQKIKLFGARKIAAWAGSTKVSCVGKKHSSTRSTCLVSRVACSLYEAAIASDRRSRRSHTSLTKSSKRLALLVHCSLRGFLICSGSIPILTSVSRIMMNDDKGFGYGYRCCCTPKSSIAPDPYIFEILWPVCGACMLPFFLPNKSPASLVCF